MSERTPAPSVETKIPALLDDLTVAQREAVTHEAGPLLIVAGAGTGKTTVIARRIAWLMATQRAAPEEILALTFTEKAAREMEERVDLLVPYGYVEIAIQTFHAFGDQLLRAHAARIGLSPSFRVLSHAQLCVFLQRHLFELPLVRFRPLHDPGRFLEAIATVFTRAKDEAVDPAEWQAYAARLAEETATHHAASASRLEATDILELGAAYAAYQRLLRDADAVDFGDQVLLTIRLLEEHPPLQATLQRRFRYVLVDEFQDTNFAQFRLLQLLSPPGSNLTVVADDDQSIYQWRGAAISNIIKFLDADAGVRTVVLTENFRSTQPILDRAYQLIQHNDPDRLEAREGIDKRLLAQSARPPREPEFHVFDTVSSEADWVANTIRIQIESGAYRPSELAVLVRSNREADIFLRALNVAGVPWQFSGSSGLFANEDVKMLLSCLRALADPEDSLSWYHVASSALYRMPMQDLVRLFARANRSRRSLRDAMADMAGQSDGEAALKLSAHGSTCIQQLLSDVQELVERSRDSSAGQLLYQWLERRGFLAQLARNERLADAAQLHTIARFFHHLRRVEEIVGGRLPDITQHLDLFQALGDEPVEDDDTFADRVHVLTLHKAKGLEFPMVFLVGLIQGRFPTPKRRDGIELPDALIQDILPEGNYHLQEERRLFYVGMTRAKDVLHLSCAYDYGGKTSRKISQFVLEALNLATPSPPAKRASAREVIEQSRRRSPIALEPPVMSRTTLRLDPHGVDDYLTCPLKYQYTHVVKIPVMRHHVVVYGAALHKAIEGFFRRQLDGQPMAEEELLAAFDQAWKSEGFLTRSHEELRRSQGHRTLQRFFAAQQGRDERPLLIEAKFQLVLGDVRLVGRWDRVDRTPEGIVIIDYKSSDVREQAAATRRTKASLQLLLYALAWHTLHGELPARVELRFPETDLIGEAVFSEDDLVRARQKVADAAAGIRARRFEATPNDFACRWCAYQSICPFAFQGK